MYYLVFLYDDKSPAFDHPKLDDFSRDLISSILRSEPAERPSMIDLKEHAFFREQYPEPRLQRSREEVMEKLTRVIDEGYELTLTAETAADTAISTRLPSEVVEQSQSHHTPTSKMPQMSEPATTISYTSHSYKRDYAVNDSIAQRQKDTQAIPIKD